MPRTTVDSQRWSLKPLVTWGLLPLGPPASRASFLTPSRFLAPSFATCGPLHVLVHLVEFCSPPPLAGPASAPLPHLCVCVSPSGQPSLPLSLVEAFLHSHSASHVLYQRDHHPKSNALCPPLSPPDGKLHVMVSSSKPGVLSALNEYLVGNQRVVFILFLAASFESE